MSPEELLRDYPVRIPISVRWGDMDAFQHVNNVVYMRYFESVRVAYFEETAVMVESGIPRGVGPILASASVRYKAPVTYPDALYAGIRVSALSTDRFTMEFAIVSETLGRVAASGDGVIVSYDYDDGVKALLPSAWRTAIERIEGRTFEA